MKKTYTIKGMDCASCAQMLELDLEDAGIKASCSYSKEELQVELKDTADDEKVKEITQNSGYLLT